MRLLVWLPLVALCACGTVMPRFEAAEEGSVDSAYSAPSAASTIPFLKEVPLLGFLFKSSGDSVLEANSDPDAKKRLMVYAASLSMQVAQAEVAITEFLAVVDRHGGYLASRKDQQLTVRVPAAKLGQVLQATRALGRTLHESMKADDVTDRHRDLGIRLDNAKKSRDRLLELLAKAQEVKDVLAIEKELQRLTIEIETLTATLQTLNRDVALSTLVVSFAGVSRPDSATRRPKRSRFLWINRIGAEHAIRNF